MKAHTLGPWQNNYNGQTPHVASANGFVLAHIYPMGNTGEGEANARLVAAAPDMLDALKALRQAIDEGDLVWAHPGKSDADPYHAANTLLNVALSKATAA